MNESDEKNEKLVPLSYPSVPDEIWEYLEKERVRIEEITGALSPFSYPVGMRSMR